MESRAKLLGHPIHPMLIVFPLGLLATAVAFDIVGLARSESEWFRISFWMIAAGIIGGLFSAVFGLVDWLAIPDGTRAKRIGLWHGVRECLCDLAVYHQLVSASSYAGEPWLGRLRALLHSSCISTGDRLAGRRAGGPTRSGRR
jgi:Predicted membrane protein (DUF2231)